MTKKFAQLRAKPLKYQELAAAIRTQVKSGVLLPGDRLPSFIEMRSLHGATQGTAHKALQILESEGLILREPGRGVFVAPMPNTASPSIASNRISSARSQAHKVTSHSSDSLRKEASKGVIGISGAGFSAEFYSAYFASLVRGIQRAASQVGMQVLILDYKSSAGWEKADGVILCDWSRLAMNSRRPLAQPLVSALVNIPSTARVLADDAQGGYLATRHLLELGHRRIAYVHGQDNRIFPLRLEGYHHALRESGIEPNAAWLRALSDNYFYDSDFATRGKEAMQQWLENEWSTLGCTAIIAYNDATAIGIISALREAGLDCPRDVSVVGFDGGEVSLHSTPRLSTVEVPLEEIGEQSVQLLLDQIANDETVTIQRVLPVKFVARESSAPCPSPK